MDATPTPAPVKSGKTTTEFWGKTIAQLMTAGLAYFDIALSPETAMVIIAGLEAIYMVVRSYVKGRASR